ncbi:MAG: hypothetical protein E7551_03070 [Ruminococcaceae bacterium]|nr:hypothetical protein [Oscillospiraceae bacterium]
MKRKILSFFMATILLFITVSVGFVVNSASQNLISNGDFKEYSNNIPANWNVSLKSNTTAQVVENVSIADGITANAVKFTTTATNSQRSEFYYTGKVKIERNTTYTTTFWVKSDSIAGFKAYMYEPTYTDTSGNQKTSNIAVEGQNIYTYTYDNGSTRVIRTDIAHSWTIAQTGAVIDKTSTASMFIYRYNGTNLFPSTDYPNQTKAGEWVQIMHTFKTGDDTAHIAEVSYDFAIPEAVDGEFWIANVVMTAQSDNVETPEASITDSLEDYANGTLLAQITHTKAINATDTDWTETSYLNTTKDGKGIYYVDSNYSGTFRKATVTTAAARTGKNSISLQAPYSYLGRKFTGLEKNTRYTISFYAKGNSSSQFGDLIVTTTNMTIYNTNGSIKANTEFIARSNNRYTASDVWSEATITFNSGDNTEVMLWTNYLGNSTLYLDDFTISQLPDLFKPSVNNSAFGTVSPSTEIECYNGKNATVTASPNPNINFIGWYINDKLVSSDTEFTFEYSNGYQGLTAVFENIPGIINDDLEEYENGTLLAQITHTKNISATDTDWTETSYLNTANDGKGVYYIESSYGGTFRKATVTTDAARTGKNSILLNAPYGYLGRKFTGLEKNTQYTISFYAKSASASQFGNLTITTPNMTIYNTNGTIKANTEFIARNTALYTASDVWSEATITFNSGDNTEVILWINHLSRTTLYLDDFAVYEYIMATVNAERGGDVKLNYDPEKIPVGANVTVEATPYSGNTFICWRDETGKLVSTSPKYTFTANTNFTLTALFDGNNMPEFDAFSIEDYDGTFENGTIGNWYFEDTISGYASYWCSAVRTTDNAYEGDYSITLRSRYRDAVLPINVYAHTNYTLSFYIKFAATDDDASISYAAVLPYNKANPHSTNKIFATADITPSNEWQKVEFNFNSESCTNLKFILRYTTNSLNNADYVYLDNISLVCKDYTGPQRTEFFTPGNIDGDDADNANLLDLITLAQYVANWENISVDTKALDVNGDSLVDLEDVLTLSRVLAGWNSVKLSTSPYISYPN